MNVISRIRFGFVGRLGAFLVRAIYFTMRIKRKNREVVLDLCAKGSSYIIVFWHARLLMMPFARVAPVAHVIISRHSDGEYIARVSQRLGIRSIRGSTTRGGRTAFIAAARRLKAGEVVGVTPDGPKGPVHSVQPGTIRLAMMTGVPVIPLAFGCSRFWEFRSWDRFRIPKPFSRGVFIWGDPIYFPPRMSDSEIENACNDLREVLLALNKQADEEAQGKAQENRQAFESSDK